MKYESISLSFIATTARLHDRREIKSGLKLVFPTHYDHLYRITKSQLYFELTVQVQDRFHYVIIAALSVRDNRTEHLL